MIVIVTADTST